MTKHEIAVLTVRVLGIYFLVQGLSFISSEITHLSELPKGFFFPAISSVIAGVLLWWLANPLARHILPGKDSPSEDTRALLPEAFQRIAFTTIGLFLLVTRIPSLVFSYMFYFRTSERELSQGALIRLRGQGTIAGAATGILFGVLLLCFSGYLARVLSRRGKTGKNP